MSNSEFGLDGTVQEPGRDKHKVSLEEGISVLPSGNQSPASHFQGQ